MRHERTPLVSVVMPAYDRADRVGAAVESILQQSLTDLELIVIDDASRDGSASIAEQFRDRRMTVVRLPANLGNAAARDIGMQLARAPFLAVMDSDDISLPHRLERQLQFLETNAEVDLLAADATRVTGPLREPMRWPRDDGQIKAMLLHVDGAMIHPTVVMRSAFVRSCGIRYTAAMRTDADNDFYVQAMAAGARFHNLGEPLLDYHRHPGNVTNDPLLRQRKRSVRRRVAGLFFPELRGVEIEALIATFDPTGPLTVQQAAHGLSALDHARLEERSFFGESRAQVRLLVDERRAALVQALQLIGEA